MQEFYVAFYDHGESLQIGISQTQFMKEGFSTLKIVVIVITALFFAFIFGAFTCIVMRERRIKRTERIKKSLLTKGLQNEDEEEEELSDHQDDT